MLDWKKLNREVIEEFRANAGRVSQFGDLPVVILNTLGARSGKLLEVPLITVIDDGDMFLFASNAGSKKTPAWVFNVRAHPVINVEFESSTFNARIHELSGDDAAGKVVGEARRTEQFAVYVKSAAPRNIPVFRIEPLN